MLDETHRIERVNKAVEQFCVGIFDIAILSLGHKPLWLINNFVFGASQLAISMLPDSEKRTIQRLCLERMLKLTATTECDESLETGLFDSLCDLGFSSETNAVNCTQIYCNWLMSNGSGSMVPQAVDRARHHVSHPYFLSQLDALEAGQNA